MDASNFLSLLRHLNFFLIRKIFTEIKLTYNTASSRCTVICYFYTLQNDHHDKSSYHLLPYKVIKILLTIFPNLHNSYLWLIYFVTERLYLLISLTYFSHPSKPPPLRQHLFVLCIYDSISVLLCLFICFGF